MTKKLPQSWSELTWQQLVAVWECKMRYGGSADAARVAVLLSLLGLTVGKGETGSDGTTGEAVYTLTTTDGTDHYTATPRELAHIARKNLIWVDYPYGDPGEPSEKDEKGKVVKEAREPVIGYVNPNFQDAMLLPQEDVVVDGIHFALPQLACNNLTWQQYRSLQGIVPQIFQESISDEQTRQLQTEFLGHCLVPEQPQESADKFRPKRVFRYNEERAEQTVSFWAARLADDSRNAHTYRNVETTVLYHICFQCYQTAVIYYARAYPLLFSGDDKQDPLRDALTGEVGTINTVMKYAGYSEQQLVYDSNLPFVLDILNTMTKEAKEIEKMNSKIKRK